MNPFPAMEIYDFFFAGIKINKGVCLGTNSLRLGRAQAHQAWCPPAHHSHTNRTPLILGAAQAPDCEFSQICLNCYVNKARRHKHKAQSANLANLFLHQHYPGRMKFKKKS